MDIDSTVKIVKKLVKTKQLAKNAILEIGTYILAF